MAILRRARQRFPGDLWINFNLAVAMQKLRPPRMEEAIRYYTVVQSIRPEAAHALGDALHDVGRDDEVPLGIPRIVSDYAR